LYIGFHDCKNLAQDKIKYHQQGYRHEGPTRQHLNIDPYISGFAVLKGAPLRGGDAIGPAM
jgi:hypothetical protein